MIAVLLTCTAMVHRDVFTSRNNLSDRVSDYLSAINFWLNCKHVDAIVVVDNSGYDFSKHYIQPKNNIEFLTFNADGGYDVLRGKGYGEYLILKFAIDNSQLLRASSKIIKLTGRYTIGNPEMICGLSTDFDIHADFSRNLSWVDSRFFCANKNFFYESLPILSHINEESGYYMEFALARAVHACMALGYTWNMLPDVPKFQGYYGRENTRFSDSIFKFYVKRLMKRIKKFAINFRY